MLACALHRHGDAEVRTGELAIDYLDVAAVGQDELEHYGQPDAGALDGYAARGASGVESFENVGPIFGRNTRPVVSDIQLERGSLAACA